MLVVSTSKYNPCTSVVGIQLGYHDCERAIQVVISIIGYDLIIKIGLGPREENTYDRGDV